MNKTWDAIAGDCLVDDNGRADEHMSIPRSSVLELVLDADHMATYGGDGDAAAYTIMVKHYHPTHWKRLLKLAFPYTKYGY
jgi:hypothetical protein